MNWAGLCSVGLPGADIEPNIQEQVEVQVKYEGYIKRDRDIVQGVQKNEQLQIPVSLNFDEVPGLSNEIRGRLKLTRPETIGQASRMQGVTPAAVANLMIFMKMRQKSSKKPAEAPRSRNN